MKDSFLDTAHTIIFFKHKSSSSSSSSLVQHTVMQLMPVLAEYDTASFVSYHIAPSMDLLVRSLGVPGDRDVASASIGRLARAVGAEICPFLDRIMSNVRSALHSASTSSSPVASTSFASLYTYSTTSTSTSGTGAGVGAVFECIGMLVQSAVGPLIMGTLHGMLDEMFGCGLSRELWVLLEVVSGNLPALLRPIQVRMLDVLSTTLTGKPFVACGAPPFEQHLPMSKGKGKGKMVNGTGSPKSPTHATMRDPASVKLALEVLGSFDLSEHTLTEFIRDAALPYISHPNAEVRCGAALTCASLLLRDSIVYHMSQHATEIVHEVMGRVRAASFLNDQESRIEHFRALLSGFPGLEALSLEIEELPASRSTSPLPVSPALRRLWLDHDEDVAEAFSHFDYDSVPHIILLSPLAIPIPAFVQRFVPSPIVTLDIYPELSGCIASLQSAMIPGRTSSAEGYTGIFTLDNLPKNDPLRDVTVFTGAIEVSLHNPHFLGGAALPSLPSLRRLELYISSNLPGSLRGSEFPNLQELVLTLTRAPGVVHPSCSARDIESILRSTPQSVQIVIRGANVVEPGFIDLHVHIATISIDPRVRVLDIEPLWVNTARFATT